MSKHGVVFSQIQSQYTTIWYLYSLARPHGSNWRHIFSYQADNSRELRVRSLRCLIHKPHVEQHDLRIKSLNESKYLSLMRSGSYLSCCKRYAYIQGVTRVNFVINITLQGSSFPVRSWIGIYSHSVIHLIWIKYVWLGIK